MVARLTLTLPRERAERVPGPALLVSLCMLKGWVNLLVNQLAQDANTLPLDDYL
jgi:hypothetical protein